MRQASQPVVALIIALGLVAGACGTSSESATTTTAAASAAAPAPSPVVEAETVAPAEAVPRATTGGSLALPAIDVINLVSGETFDLGTYSPPGPTLVWFWAPH